MYYIYHLFYGLFQKFRKRRLEESDVTNKLQNLCFEHFDEIFSSSPENDDRGEKQLALFTLLLRQALTDKNEEHLELLLNRLPHYIETCVSFNF